MSKGVIMSPKLKCEVVPLMQVFLDTQREQHRPVVLIVDDERTIADTLAVILAKNGFHPLVAYDGESALKIASVRPPQLLISDVVMTGMNGIELAVALIRSVPDCKVLLFSGQAATMDLLAHASAEGHRFTTLSKPVHPTELLAHVEECLAGSMRRQCV